MTQNTLVIIKPDAVRRGLTGEIMARLLRPGLTLEQIRVSTGEADKVDNHYPRDDQWLETVGNKTLTDYSDLGYSALDRLGTDSALEIGRQIRGWLTDYLLSGPIVPMVISGNRSIDAVRKIIGTTLPVTAAPGTIRGDFSTDSASLATEERRPVENLVHASGDPDEAAREIKLWFP